jgi:hypothetical protein
MQIHTNKAREYSKMACNTITFYFMFKIYIFTKNGQISLKYFSASLRFSVQSTIRPNFFGQKRHFLKMKGKCTIF